VLNENFILTTRLFISPVNLPAFSQWKVDYNAAIATFPGFISLEILAPHGGQDGEWVIIQRFQTSSQLEICRNSRVRRELLETAKKYLLQNQSIKDEIEEISRIKGGITEVFITEVSSEKETQYREWMAKIHQIESRFPGFRGTYVQAPVGQGKNWITMLQFDTTSNLDRWLESDERKETLHELETMITSLERHRVISPYAGWFTSIINDGDAPSVWKQTMLVLLMLFPIVMLELKYLSPLTVGLDSSIATFFANSISVALLAWPMMPFAIWLLRWWLSPSPTTHFYVNWFGTVLIFVLYVLEIAIFWGFLA
jgi:hypothetical protein